MLTLLWVKEHSGLLSFLEIWALNCHSHAPMLQSDWYTAATQLSQHCLALPIKGYSFLYRFCFRIQSFTLHLGRETIDVLWLWCLWHYSKHTYTHITLYSSYILQIWTIALNKLNKQSPTADRRWSCCLGHDRGLATILL